MAKIKTKNKGEEVLNQQNKARRRNAKRRSQRVGVKNVPLNRRIHLQTIL